MNTSTALPIPLPMEAIRAFCQRWGARELALFGSVLREDFRPDSDLDVLVTFAPGGSPSLFEFVEIADELEAILGRKVDLVTRGSVETSPNYLLRREVLETAQVIYAA
ncbi:MAG: nucleotidyltransferase family protein [Anaerolineae bacterium]|nr:nucleotidyltransferase family protein [Anaerolineae bacterium]